MFGYKCLITPEQFFKYGFAEQKMLLCCDAIALVRRKHRQLANIRSLSARRVSVTRKNQSGTFTTLSHDQGRQHSFYYERDTPNKKVNLSGLGSDFRPSSRISCKDSSAKRVSKAFRPDESQISNRSRSIEAAERLTGSTAFRMPNRHRT